MGPQGKDAESNCSRVRYTLFAQCNSGEIARYNKSMNMSIDDVRDVIPVYIDAVHHGVLFDGVSVKYGDGRAVCRETPMLTLTLSPRSWEGCRERPRITLSRRGLLGGRAACGGWRRDPRDCAGNEAIAKPSATTGEATREHAATRRR